MSDDLEIFVFTAANSTAQENLLKSIENPIMPKATIMLLGSLLHFMSQL
jgi:hypothetical protein